jgi:transcriptional regulator with XRE-family HTH domain
MIGENIKRKLKERRMHVSELSKKTGIPASTLYSYTGNVGTPSAKAIKKIADALNTSTDELLKESEAAYPTTDELRGAPGASAMFVKDGFYDRMTPEDKKLLEKFLECLKDRYK